MKIVHITFLAFLAVLSICTGEAFGQNSDPRLLSSESFALSPEATAAGIYGKLRVNATVAKDGSLKDVFLYGQLAWPCGKNVEDQIHATMAAIKENLKKSKFAPALKDGKPQNVGIGFDFAVGETYKEMMRAEEAEKAAAAGMPLPKIVDYGVLKGRAVYLPHPDYPKIGTFGPIRNDTIIRIIVGKDGSVESAGVISGLPQNFTPTRIAACSSKFTPTLLRGEPIKVTGTIIYSFDPTPNRPPTF